MVIEPLGKLRCFSRTFMTDLLAFPFSGGAFTLTFNVSSNQPAIQSFDEEGITLIDSFIYYGVSLSSSTRRQLSSSRITSCLAQRENSFFDITPELRLSAPAVTL